MEHYLTYTGKVSIAIIAFYLTYSFFFKKSKDFVFNRYYLIGSMGLAFLIPLLTITKPIYSYAAEVYLEGFMSGRAGLPVEDQGLIAGIDLPAVLFCIYWLGVMIALVKLLHGIYGAAVLKKMAKKSMIGRMEVEVSSANISAFTFFDKIIVGKNILDHPSLNLILDHEAVHAREKHYCDILIAELLLVLQWFNPLAHLQVQAIRNNLEFQADELVVRNADMQEYLMTMLSMAVNRIKHPLFTALTSSNLKQRIIMIKSNTSPKYVTLARLALLPLISLLLLSLAQKKTEVFETGEKDGFEAKLSIEPSQDVLNTVEELNQYLSRSIKYPLEAREAGHIGIISIYASLSESGMIKEVLDKKPEGQIVEHQEIVIIGYQNTDTTPITYGGKDVLLDEGRRVINSLPKLNISEFKGEVVKFKFKFLIR
ncbi:MAG TPA: M56 family metallopeptidase [Cyclobacteriaceae bacterium]|nr:M56 family metallopeptidase [Cyclobacteriaceae bacterium]